MQSPAPSSPTDPHSRRLVLVTHEFYPHRGGIAIYVAEMARAACQLGYDVEVWAPALPAGVAELTCPFMVRRLPLAGDHSLRSQWRMARALLAQRTELRKATLYILEPGPLLAMLLLQYFRTLSPARLMLTFYGSEIQRLAARWLLRWSTNHLLCKATRISVISAFTQQLLERHFPIASGKVVITPGALRTDLRVDPPAAPAAARPRLVILTVARLNPRKGQLEVIAALQALPAAQRARLEYWLVGAHSKENYGAALAAAAAAADFPVKFLGDIPDDQLGALYAQADIFAMTSMPHRHSVEGFGLVFLEAGAHGVPVIAHAIGGVPEVVVDGETGLLVAPGDQPALTAAFARLLDEPALRRRLGDAGRSHAHRRTWRDSAETLLGQAPATGST
jgi:phosphatidylinositol alpha-1,6-mannosyltransferase